MPKMNSRTLIYSISRGLIIYILSGIFVNLILLALKALHVSSSSLVIAGNSLGVVPYLVPAFLVGYISVRFVEARDSIYASFLTGLVYSMLLLAYYIGMWLLMGRLMAIDFRFVVLRGLVWVVLQVGFAVIGGMLATKRREAHGKMDI